MSIEQAIERELKSLRKEIDCTDCPEERHCCIFGAEDYGLRMTKKSANILLGDKMAELEAEGRLVIKGKYAILQNGPCPALYEDMTCSVHSKLEAIGLTKCVGYPIFLGTDENKVTKLALDYRCTFVERNWEQVRDAATTIVQKLFETVVIYRSEGINHQRSLSTFETMYDDQLPSQAK